MMITARPIIIKLANSTGVNTETSIKLVYSPRLSNLDEVFVLCGDQTHIISNPTALELKTLSKEELHSSNLLGAVQRLQLDPDPLRVVEYDRFDRAYTSI